LKNLHKKTPRISGGRSILLRKITAYRAGNTLWGFFRLFPCFFVYFAAKFHRAAPMLRIGLVKSAVRRTSADFLSRKPHG